MSDEREELWGEEYDPAIREARKAKRGRDRGGRMSDEPMTGGDAVILTDHELIELMEATPPEEWPNTRGYGYSGVTGRRIKDWHIAVVKEFLSRAEPSRPSLADAMLESRGGIDHE